MVFSGGKYYDHWDPLTWQYWHTPGKIEKIRFLLTKVPKNYGKILGALGHFNGVR
jgi:hypothetical protein